MSGIDQGAPAMALLQAEGLGKVFGHVRALRDVTFSLYPAEVLAVVGDNGAGKSTLIKIFSGALDPTEGEILVRGQKVSFGKPGEAAPARVAPAYTAAALSD